MAIARATAWDLRENHASDGARFLLGAVLRRTPEGKVRAGILTASVTPPDTAVAEVARALGNGFQVTAPDTVPFCIWMAAHHLNSFIDALGKTISAGGDCDTNAAIVCGIVASSGGREGIPAEWLKARETISV